MTCDTWTGCYPSSWRGKIVKDAMSHPAKYSSKLIRRIYEHMIAEGWIKAGDRVLDPFGGVALGAFDAMRHGLHWYGCELEPRFVGLGNENIMRWQSLFSRFSNSGSARLVQGDSRKLGAMRAQGFEAAISNPPFLQSEGGAHVPSNYVDDPTFMARHAAGNKSSHAYGETDGQLSGMKDGGFDAAISSPPYSAMQVEKNAKSIDRTKQYEVYKRSGGGQTFEQFCRTQVGRTRPER